MPRKSEIIKCEVCNCVNAVIVHEKIYYCADCYIFENKIPMPQAVNNLNIEGTKDKLKN